MSLPRPSLSLMETKSKELVPAVDGVPLHSLHNPRREAEVLASNHLAHLYKSPNALVLGLGFGYHIEEIAKILRLRHRNYRIGVIEAFPELTRMMESYRGELPNTEIFAAKTTEELWQNQALGRFLLEKPVVIIHSASFAAAKPFYEKFLGRRAPQTVGEWQVSDTLVQSFLTSNATDSLANIVQGNHSGPPAGWLRAFWECKHAE